MKSLVSLPIITKRLCLQDAPVMEEFFNHHDMAKSIPPELFISDEPARDFVNRMLWRCEFFWSIRLMKHPEQIIGFVMLYKWDRKSKDAYLSGFMLPGFNYANLLTNGLNAGIEIAKHLLNIQAVHNSGPQQNGMLLKVLLSMGFFHNNSSPTLLSRPTIWKAPFKQPISQKLTKTEHHRKIAV